MMSNPEMVIESLKRLSAPMQDQVIGIIDGIVVFCNRAGVETLHRDPEGIAASEIIEESVLNNAGSEFMCPAIFAAVPATAVGMRFDNLLVLTFFLIDKNRYPVAIVPKSIIAGLRSALGNLHMSADLLIRNADPESRERLSEYERTLYHSYYSLLRLITNLETINGIISGDLHLSTRVWDIGAICRDLLISASLPPSPERAAIIYDGPDEKIISMADREKFEQMLLNVLSNSLLHTPVDGTISVSLKLDEKNKNMMIITISDTGSGIPREIFGSIFARYDQDPSLSEMAGGQGLGLTIAKGVAELHGGSIMVESKEGEGTKTAIKLPVKNDSGLTVSIPDMETVNIYTILRELSTVLRYESYDMRRYGD